MLSGGSTSVIARLLATSACLAVTFALVQAPAEAAARVTVSGVVTSPDAGHPGLAGIEVCAQRYDKKGKYRATYCRTTGSDGRYSMSVPADTYRFTAEQQYLYGDWVAQSYNGGKSYKVGSAKTVNFQMVRGARITGHLSVPAGHTLTNNFLGINAYRLTANGRVGNSPLAISNTNDDGYFEISKLPAGRYALRMEDNGYEPRLATQWFPNAATAKSSTVLTVASGQLLTGNDMALIPGATLRFTIKNPSGKVVPGNINLYDADGRNIFSPHLEKYGVVKFTGLHPGNYRASGSTHTVNYTQWYSSKKSLATANPITVGAGATLSRTLTVRYPTLKATKRPKVKVDLNTVISKPPKWNKKARTYDIVWYRDGKRTKAPGFDHYSTSKSDVGHRIKACYIAVRTGYADGRSCSRYTKKIKMY